MWDLIVSVSDHCLSFYSDLFFILVTYMYKSLTPKVSYSEIIKPQSKLKFVTSMERHFRMFSLTSFRNHIKSNHNVLSRNVYVCHKRLFEMVQLTCISKERFAIALQRSGICMPFVSYYRL